MDIIILLITLLVIVVVLSETTQLCEKLNDLAIPDIRSGVRDIFSNTGKDNQGCSYRFGYNIAKKIKDLDRGVACSEACILLHDLKTGASIVSFRFKGFRPSIEDIHNLQTGQIAADLVSTTTGCPIHYVT